MTGRHPWPPPARYLGPPNLSEEECITVLRAASFADSWGCLRKGRQPNGLRDLAAKCIRYLRRTGRYENIDLYVGSAGHRLDFWRREREGLV